MALEKPDWSLLVALLLIMVAHHVSGAAAVRNTRKPGTFGGPCTADQDCIGNEKDPPNYLKCVERQCECDHKHLFRNKQCVIKADMVFQEDQFDLSQPCVPFAYRIKMGNMWICECQAGYKYFKDECQSKDSAGRIVGTGSLIMGLVVSLVLVVV